MLTGLPGEPKPRHVGRLSPRSKNGEELADEEEADDDSAFPPLPSSLEEAAVEPVEKDVEERKGGVCVSDPASPKTSLAPLRQLSWRGLTAGTVAGRLKD